MAAHSYGEPSSNRTQVFVRSALSKCSIRKGEKPSFILTNSGRNLVASLSAIARVLRYWLLPETQIHYDYYTTPRPILGSLESLLASCLPLSCWYSINLGFSIFLNCCPQKLNILHKTSQQNSHDAISYQPERFLPAIQQQSIVSEAWAERNTEGLRLRPLQQWRAFSVPTSGPTPFWSIIHPYPYCCHKSKK